MRAQAWALTKFNSNSVSPPNAAAARAVRALSWRNATAMRLALHCTKKMPQAGAVAGVQHVFAHQPCWQLDFGAGRFLVDFAPAGQGLALISLGQRWRCARILSAFQPFEPFSVFLRVFARTSPPTLSFFDGVRPARVWALHRPHAPWPLPIDSRPPQELVATPSSFLPSSRCILPRCGPCNRACCAVPSRSSSPPRCWRNF